MLYGRLRSLAVRPPTLGVVTREELVAGWTWFAERECRGYSPLYEAISTVVAASTELHERLLACSNHVRQPNMLLAAMHDLVLRDEEPDLGAHYGGAAPTVADTGRLFVETALRRWEDLVPVLEARRTQTNEVGRIAVLAPALATVTPDEPVTLIDVGTSAGLTLTLPHCRIDFGERGVEHVRPTCQNGDVGARLRKTDCHALAEPFTAARDQRSASFQ